MTLEERIAELERQVAKLEGEQDQITPNAYSIGPKGEVNETLTGFLNARGISFPPTTAPAPNASIAWEDGKGGDAAEISSWALGGATHLSMFSNGPWGEAILASYQIAAEAQLYAYVNFHLAVILDQEGRSSFPQLDAGFGNKVRLAFGYANVNYAGGTEDSEIVLVNLPRPAESNVYYFTQPEQSYGNSRLGMIVDGQLDHFELYVHSVVGEPPAGTKEVCWWLAVLVD